MIGPNLYGADFGGRTPTHTCQTCGTPLARLSPVEWVDRANNKAAEEPTWHEHTVATADNYNPAATRAPYAGHNLPRGDGISTSASGELLFEGRYPRHNGAS